MGPLRRGVLASAALASLSALLPSSSCAFESAEDGEGACLEQQVESMEDQLAEDMSMTLLQVALKQGREPVAVAMSEQPAAAATPAVPAQAAAATPVALPQQAEAANSSLSQEPVIDCTEKPMFCNEKINCVADPLTPYSRAALEKKLAHENNTVNYKGWCLVYPQYATSLQRCVIDKDPAGYAEDTIKEQTKLNLLYADAVYCYASGHCSSEKPRYDTNQQQMEKLCDKRYGGANLTAGREKWANVGYSELRGVFNMAYDMTKRYFENKTSWEDIKMVAKTQAGYAAMAACAMGNFHCDAIYCHTHFCGNDKYERFTEFA